MPNQAIKQVPPRYYRIALRFEIEPGTPALPKTTMKQRVNSPSNFLEQAGFLKYQRFCNPNFLEQAGFLKYLLRVYIERKTNYLSVQKTPKNRQKEAKD